MSKARSPRLVCSTTIGINGLNLPSFQPDITVQREEKPSGLLLSRHSLLLFLILSFFTFLRGINAYSTIYNNLCRLLPEHVILYIYNSTRLLQLGSELGGIHLASNRHLFQGCVNLPVSYTHLRAHETKANLV